MIAGNGLVPAAEGYQRVQQVERIRKNNCHRGCRRAGNCGLLARVLAGGGPVGALLDDGAQIYCLDRHALRTPPPRPIGGLVDAEELTLFDPVEMGGAP